VTRAFETFEIMESVLRDRVHGFAQQRYVWRDLEICSDGECVNTICLQHLGCTTISTKRHRCSKGQIWEASKAKQGTLDTKEFLG
jgi:hypothetical protein